MNEALGFREIAIALIAGVAVVAGATITQLLKHVFRERQAFLGEARTRFVLKRTDVILGWGQAIETARLETDKNRMLQELKSASENYGAVVHAAYRQDSVLGTSWRQEIEAVHGLVESLEELEDVDFVYAKKKLASCERRVANLLNEVEWWRLFLLRAPMPSRARLLAAKVIAWGPLGPRKLKAKDE